MIFLLSVFHIRASYEPVEAEELMFWFRLLPLMGIMSILMGGEGRHSQRTWREEVRWSSGQDPGHLSLPQSWISSLGKGHVLPSHFGYSSLSFGLTLSDRVANCLFFFFFTIFHLGMTQMGIILLFYSLRLSSKIQAENSLTPVWC